MGDRRDVPRFVVVEIRNKRCKVLEALREFGIHQFKVIDVRSTSGGLTRHLVELPPDQINKVTKSNTVRMGGSCKIGGRTCLWFESNGCEVCNAMLAHGSFLVSGRSVGGDVFVYSFVAPNFDAYRGILSALKDSGLDFKILRVKEFRSTGKALTERQEMVLWLALRAGFFEYPRRVDTTELSRMLGISSSTLSEIIRRGLRRLLEHYFETK